MFNIIITDKIHKEGLEIFRRQPFCHIEIKNEIAREALLDCIEYYDAILIRSRTHANEELIRKGKKLKIIGRAGVGTDNIDITTAKEFGIRILNVDDESSISVAEHTIGLLISLAKRISQANQSVKKGLWEREKYYGIEIYNKTLGIIGLGRIGTEVAFRAKALGMHVIAYDCYCSREYAEKLGVRLIALSELLRFSDFLSIHVPKNEETTNLISFRELGLCKKGIHIINTARGGLINENALLQGLREGIINGVALDVFEDEPLVNEGFLTSDQVILTPHIAGNTKEAQTRIAISIAKKMINALCETEEFLAKHR